MQRSDCYKKELVDEANFIENVGYMMTIDQTLTRAPLTGLK